MREGGQNAPADRPEPASWQSNGQGQNKKAEHGTRQAHKTPATETVRAAGRQQSRASRRPQARVPLMPVRARTNAGALWTVRGLRVIAWRPAARTVLRRGFYEPDGAVLSLLVLALAIRLPRRWFGPVSWRHSGRLRAYRRAAIAGTAVAYPA